MSEKGGPEAAYFSGFPIRIVFLSCVNTVKNNWMMLVLEA